MLETYTTPTRFTDLTQHNDRIESLPSDIAGLAKAVQGVLYHYTADPYIFGYQYPGECLIEIETRYATGMIDRLLEKDTAPLTQPRPYEKRLLGCCRDFAVLFTAMARAKGIPCRVRYGFAAYLMPGYYLDHVIAEVWKGERWVLVDPEMSPAHIEAYGIDFDVLDIPRDQFIVGGCAWQQVEAGTQDPNLFCVIPDMPEPRGKPFVALHVQQDLAALNNVESLCWEWWGIAYQMGANSSVSDNDLAFLRWAAEATCGDADDLNTLQTLYADERLRMPEGVFSFTPAADPATLPIRMKV